jgi:uncharacterized glyoxalase superfamily protein PhnB
MNQEIEEHDLPEMDLVDGVRGKYYASYMEGNTFELIQEGPTMLTNRSKPPGTVIPELDYPDVGAAAAWLCAAFGFAERLRIANHRFQLTIGDGSIVVVERHETEGSGHRSSTMVSVEGIDEHCRRAEKNGANILRPPATHVYGERQYTAEDPGGHVWTFTESVADVHPRDWGGELIAE